MGLLANISDKFIVPARPDLANFKENIKMNQEIIKKNIKKISKDVNKFLDSKFSRNYVEDFYNDKISNKQRLLAVSGSENFACCMESIIEYQKWYALYYMNCEKAKTEKERRRISDNLVDVYDACVYTMLKYFNYEIGEYLVWVNNCEFMFSKDSKKQELVMFAIKNLNNIIKLIDAIRGEDNTSVYQAYCTVADKNFCDFISDDIFEL